MPGGSFRRGPLRLAAGGRHFEHADGTPFLLLASTLWAANTARWYDPRTGAFTGRPIPLEGSSLPPRPEPAGEDWVLLLDRVN